MGKPLIIVGSVTNAMKSRSLLEQMGIRSYVERIPQSYANGGCGYCVYVPVKTDEAEDILLQHGVQIRGRADRGGKL